MLHCSPPGVPLSLLAARVGWSLRMDGCTERGSVATVTAGTARIGQRLICECCGLCR